MPSVTSPPPISMVFDPDLSFRRIFSVCNNSSWLLSCSLLSLSSLFRRSKFNALAEIDLMFVSSLLLEANSDEVFL